MQRMVAGNPKIQHHQGVQNIYQQKRGPEWCHFENLWPKIRL